MDGGGLWELGVGGADTDEGGEEREKKKKKKGVAFAFAGDDEENPFPTFYCSSSFPLFPSISNVFCALPDRQTDHLSLLLFPLLVCLSFGIVDI